MESSPRSSDAAAALADAEAARARLAAGVVVPPRFFVALGAVVAVQIAAAAVGIGTEEPLLLVGGLVVFAAAAALLLVHFRRQTGVWLGGFTSRVVLGTSVLASTAEALALVASVWAAFESAWWLVAVCSLAGGAGYALAGIRWLRTYHDAPAEHARGESVVFVALISLAALGGVALLIAGA